MAATSAALVAWKRTYENPSSVQGSATFKSRAQWYDTLWSYYESSAFEDLARWSGYKATYHLYRQTRLVYNPTRRLVDFYAGQVYPGVLTLDGDNLPDGVALAIPLPEDTKEDLRQALGQWWQWTNWQAGKAVMVRYGAVTGSVLVEVVDDLERAKVTANIVWPGNVADLTLDATGNVKAYALEYSAEEPRDPGRVTSVTSENVRRYTYRKEVDADSVRYFKDGKPFDYGDGAVVRNPYGFCPAVWVKHRDLGGDHGAPAIHGSLGKVDELNSLASHVHDQVHKVIGAPIIFWSKGKPTNILATQKRGATDELDVPEADRETMLLLSGPEGGKVESLAGNLDLAQALPWVQQLIGEIEQDHPELTLYRELRGMTQVTGPGAARMMGDVAAAVVEVQANYDLQSQKLFAMSLAIAGWRANRGDWGLLSDQQKKFLPFDLTSYAAGQLDVQISARPLVPLTPEEQVNRERQQLALDGDRTFLQSGGQPAIEARLRSAPA